MAELLTQYTYLLGDPSYSVKVYSNNDVGYPNADDHYDVFGTMYLPRVYGKDLTTFEIASSGNIAITLYDKHVLDIDRDSNSSTTYIRAIEGESLELSADSNNVWMRLDGSNQTFELFSSNQIIFTACNGIDFGASSGNVTYSSDTGDLVFFARSNVNMTSCNDVYITAYRDIILSAANGSVLFWLDPPNSNMHFSASNNVTFTATDGYMSFSQGKNSVFMMMSNYDLWLHADSNVFITACNTILEHARKNIFTMVGGCNITTSTSNNYVVHTNTNIEGDLRVLGNGGVNIVGTRSNNTDITFAFRINTLNELELVRIVHSNEQVMSSRLVSKFAVARGQPLL